MLFLQIHIQKVIVPILDVLLIAAPLPLPVLHKVDYILPFIVVTLQQQLLPTRTILHLQPLHLNKGDSLLLIDDHYFLMLAQTQTFDLSIVLVNQFTSEIFLVDPNDVDIPVQVRKNNYTAFNTAVDVRDLPLFVHIALQIEFISLGRGSQIR